MTHLDALSLRRTHYVLNRNLPASEEEVTALIEKITALTPDAFNMRSARAIVALGGKQDALWDAIDNAFGGKVPKEKIDGFRSAYGTVLYFIDESVVRGLQEQFPRYADNFPLWSNHANGMLQFNIWTGLRSLGIGANLQHYNPIIDDAVKSLFHVPADWKLVAQMPFGGIAAEAAPKDGEDITQRVWIRK